MSLALAACTQLRDGAYQGTRDVEREAQLAGKKISDYLQIKPMAEDQKPKPIPPIYCYRIMQDIICYNQPIAGAERRLVGMQGDMVATPAALAPVVAPASAAAAPAPKKDKLAEMKPFYIPTPPPVAGTK